MKVLVELDVHDQDGLVLRQHWLDAADNEGRTVSVSRSVDGMQVFAETGGRMLTASLRPVVTALVGATLAPRAGELVKAYYTSADLPGNDSSWSVYSELYRPDDFAAGCPIDGSGRLVSTHASEAEADAEVDRLSAIDGGVRRS